MRPSEPNLQIHVRRGQAAAQPVARQGTTLRRGCCRRQKAGLLHEEVTSELAYPAGVGWKDVSVPKPYPREFRDDVVRVARNRDDGITLEQIAADFGVHPMT